MRARRFRAALAFLALLPVVACGPSRSEQQPLGAEGEPSPTAPPVPYAVRFPSDLPPDLAKLLPQVAESARGVGEPPTSRLAIRQRAEKDVGLLQQALRAEGYFDATVDFRLEDAKEAPPEGVVQKLERAGEAAPQVVLVFEVRPGPRYRFGGIRVELVDNPDGYPAPTPASLGLVTGEPARTQAVLDAERTMLDAARKAGFALAKLGERDAVVDHAARTMDVALRLDPGARATFGEVSFTGAEGIEIGFLRGRVPFRTGERFDPALLDESQTNLFDTNLFSTIIVKPAEQLGPDRSLDVTYELHQRPPRSIGAELGYQTDIGPSARLFWEHRNLFGGGELFRAETNLSQPDQKASVALTKPDFLRTRQNLLANGAVERQDLKAYKSTSIGAGLGLEREFSRQLKGSLGVAFRYAAIQDRNKPEEVFGLVSLPGSLDWNFADDRFNPTRGGTLLLTAAPYIDVLGPSRRFFKTRFTTTRYLELLDGPELVLALRGSAGAIFGVATSDVPADERFYAGGGGSVRGIAFQKAGPLDEHNDPRGGRSLAEGSIELRSRFKNDMGFVLFLDAGTVFDTPLPGGSERLFFGAGPGFRYFTPIGPVRVDLGFPLNPRSGVDEAFQLYISIGQAF
ncbi:autotransporter assembly complex protein TamA [Benzoatithermus flavus]|uniref:Autotransporter assembly complex family protein n=1 Tax=Benzoatithermus flavus TaxID=3108223 RepID=A0ABU8XQX4_9PROT